VRKADNLPPSRAVVMKSGNLNFLEPSGPLQACNRTALPFHIHVTLTALYVWGNRREGDHGGDLGVDGWIIVRWIFRKWDVGIWTGLGWPRIETGGGRL